MLFNSAHFLIFLPVVLLLYYLLPHRAQNRLLLVASCYFYASWDWRFLAPLLISTSIDYWCAKRMEDLANAGHPKEQRRGYLCLSLVTNLGLLGFFKYFNFFTESLQEVLATFGYQPSLWSLKIILPVGISFYTFQALSYTIDVYRGQFHATRSFLDFLLAILYFPHLVAGPIQRAHSLLPQVIRPRVINGEQITSGIHLIIWGYFKKVFIADNLAPIVSQVFLDPSPDGFRVLMGVYAFAFQIYCDFSGYTDIARGVAKLMGFEFMLNFNLPYLATNPKEFWSRWHISLSTWLRDYLYVPLGGNRNGARQTYRNLMLTMIIGGLWHGAAWSFIIWGFYQGILLITHRLLEPWLDRALSFQSPAFRRLSFWVQVVTMFQLTCYGWLIFRAQSLEQIVQLSSSLFRLPWNVDLALAAAIATTVAPLVVIQLIQHFAEKLEFLSFPRVSLELRCAVYAVLVYFSLFRGGQPEAFIYFQF